MLRPSKAAAQMATSPAPSYLLLHPSRLSCTAQNKTPYSIQNTFIAKIEVQLAQGPRQGGHHSGERQMTGMCLTRGIQCQNRRGKAVYAVQPESGLGTPT